MIYDLSAFEAGCRELGIELNSVQKEQFIRFYESLIEKNKVMNLTAITEFKEVLIKHFVDSLSCVKAIDISQTKRIIDIGTGAGFPGIPLKIVFPYLEICLLDSLKKRVNFLEEVSADLDFQNISIIHGRAEEYARKKEYRETYDLCISRAVSNLVTLAEYCLPYVSIGGTFISYKSGSVREESEKAAKAIQILGGSLKDILYFQLPNSDIERSLVVIKKIKPTPGKFPRRAGIPLKEPLT